MADSSESATPPPPKQTTGDIAPNTNNTNNTNLLSGQSAITNLIERLKALNPDQIKGERRFFISTTKGNKYLVLREKGPDPDNPNKTKWNHIAHLGAITPKRQTTKRIPANAKQAFADQNKHE